MNGKVLVLGLGLGYFAFHALQKRDVESLTFTEISKDAIDLFERNLMQVFDYKEKIQLILL